MDKSGASGGEPPILVFFQVSIFKFKRLMQLILELICLFVLIAEALEMNIRHGK